MDAVMERQLELAPAFAAALGGRILPNARAAADLDADGLTELVFGSVSGDLAVFKVSPDELVLWRACRLDGAVAAICVDERASGAGKADAASLPRVVVATSEGRCFVFQSLETEEPFGPVAEFSVALNASAVAVIGDELVVGTRDGRILVFGSDSEAVGRYRQLASFEVAAEIDAMRAFSAPFVKTGGSPVLLVWCTSGEIFCYSCGQDRAGDAGDLDDDGARSVTLWNGHSDEKEDMACMVDGVAVDGVPGHVAHVAMGERVALVSPSLEKLWDVQLPEATISLDKLRLSSRDPLDTGRHDSDVLVACTWSGQLYVIKDSETRIHFRVMLPASSMFTAQMTTDGTRDDPIVVVVATSGAIFVFADVKDTISRALDRTTLKDAIEKSAVFERLQSESKRQRLLARLQPSGPSSGGDTSASTEALVRALLSAPLEAPAKRR